jgi:hypothetical protein
VGLIRGTVLSALANMRIAHVKARGACAGRSRENCFETRVTECHIGRVLSWD